MTSTHVITDGDNVTYVCSGYVGQPPESFNFQMYHRKRILFRNYTSTKTSTQELPESCSYYRKSYTTLQVTAEENQAIIRCVVVSNSANVDLYADSEPLEVYYAVRMPIINKHPNKTDYLVGSDASINLTCTTDGNPKPSYVWYKGSKIQAIGTGENFIITNLNETHGGVYTCSVSNTFKEVIHIERVQVHVHIVNNDKGNYPNPIYIIPAPVVKDTVSARSGDNVIIIGITCGSILLVLCVTSFCVVQQHRKKNLRCLTKNKDERSVGNVQTTQQDNSSFYEGVEQTLDVHSYEQLSRTEHLYTNFNV
ncbi:unnamed protein product [Mytilus coruscus]|uniref:Ig-like domain-containing protein n=1 Tax=Mytilus coruscus TaxID=42192 RepID=A0A6J8AAN1_MYTCO|nr:unnamed protein product [Mytilus coruscus]